MYLQFIARVHMHSITLSSQTWPGIVAEPLKEMALAGNRRSLDLLEKIDN